ncbi:unnamed protein product [Mytilus edulis]|uniref:Farnesoic acid O-methyl transferase domain-containing protein n=1 Tax=Mytilus edulis TaxID=6550 RepID=A0A8S3PW72_MYTED|nr:unnamed protein product [Mytilus edulis]
MIVKHFNITTPKDYGRVNLSDYCIKPTTDSSFKFEAMASDNLWVSLITDIGVTGTGYQIGIGSNANKCCDIRRGIENNLLDSSEYRPFWISWRDGKIEVGYGLIVRNTLSRLIVWDDPEPLNITEIKLSSKPEGSCIVHYPTGNTVKYTKASEKRGTPVLLSNVVGYNVVECAFRCHIEPECISFNYKESSKMCELSQARFSEATHDALYNFYSEC